MVDPDRSRPPRFPTTQWSLIDLACDGGTTARRVALDQLLARYWPAMKAHLVFKKRIDPNEADDLVQGFIHTKILERDFVAAADAQRGRFRSFLATALDHYFANQRQRQQAAKRNVDRAFSLDQEESPALATVHSLPHDTFDIAWAREILAEILQRMQQECDRSGREDIWGVFAGRVVNPILEGAPPGSYEDLLKQFGFRSPTQLSNTLVTGKRMFRRIMREVVGEYAENPEDIDTEIQELHEALAQGGL